MIVLKTIPSVPAIAEIVDSVYRVNIMSIDFVNSTVNFTVTSSYIAPYNMNSPSVAPISRIVSFAEIGGFLQPADITGFVAVIRRALALAMNVDISKVPVNIFAS